MDLNNIVGFKAVDKNGNERQVTVDEMTELVSARIVSAASEISTFAAAAAAGTDEFEDQLPQSDTFSWLRTLDGSKNPTLTSSSAAAKVLGELIGVANAEKNGLMSKNGFIDRVHVNGTSFDDDIASGIYLVNGATSADLNAPFGYGILAVFSSNGFVSQFAMQFGKDASSIRYRNFDRSVGVWNKWAVLNTIIG